MDFGLSKVVEILTGKFEGWAEGITSMIPNLLVALLVVIIFYLTGRLIKQFFLRVLNRFSDRRVINNLFSTLLYILFLTTGLFIALDILHLDKALTSLLAGAGIVGLVLGFAFQDLSANFISGVIIAFRKPIRIGDIINAKGYEGVVQDIDLRSTVIRTFQGLHVIIPNKELLQNPVTNYTKTYERRIDLEVGVSYGDDLGKVKDITINAVKDLENLLPGKEIQLVYKEFGDSSINFQVMFWIRYPEESAFLETRSQAILNIMKSYKQNDITIPFPIRTLDFGIKGGEKLSDFIVINQSDRSLGNTG
jgi:small-conductance mechanosensitive channel